MKAIIFCCIAYLSAVSGFSYSGSALLLKDRLAISPELGINSSFISKSESRAQIGFLGGVGIRIGKRKHFHTGLYYKAVRFDAKLDSQSVQSSTFQQVKADYLVVPIMMGLTPVYSKLFKVRVFGGALAMMQQNGSVQGLKDPNFSSLIWSLRAGAGLDIWKIEVNFSYDLGLTKVISELSPGKAMGYNLSMGYRF